MKGNRKSERAAGLPGDIDHNERRRGPGRKLVSKVVNANTRRGRERFRRRREGTQREGE
jgi:hypothetical protein